MSKKKKLLIIAIPCAIILLAFMAYSGVWLAHYSIQIKPSANEKLEYNEISSGEFAKSYKYTCYEAEIIYSVYVPRFLQFYGNIFVTQPVKLDENGDFEDDYIMGVSYTPRLFDDNHFNFVIRDQTGGITFIITVLVDKDFNFIEENREGAYEMFIDDMRAFYEEHVLAFFGEEVFR